MPSVIIKVFVKLCHNGFQLTVEYLIDFGKAALGLEAAVASDITRRPAAFWACCRRFSGEIFSAAAAVFAAFSMGIAASFSSAALSDRADSSSGCGIWKG